MTDALFATLGHKKDLEELLEMRKQEVRELTEEQEQFNETKDAEIFYLVKEKEKFNKEVEAKKENMEKHIDDVETRIKALVETVNAVNDVESRLSPAEDWGQAVRRTQGLKTIV